MTPFPPGKRPYWSGQKESEVLQSQEKTSSIPAVEMVWIPGFFSSHVKRLGLFQTTSSPHQDALDQSVDDLKMCQDLPHSPYQLLTPLV
jgi:hypothetical protein